MGCNSITNSVSNATTSNVATDATASNATANVTDATTTNATAADATAATTAATNATTTNAATDPTATTDAATNATATNVATDATTTTNAATAQHTIIIATASKSSMRCSVRAYEDEAMSFIAALRAEGPATRQSVLCDGSSEVLDGVEASAHVQCILLRLWLWLGMKCAVVLHAASAHTISAVVRF